MKAGRIVGAIVLIGVAVGPGLLAGCRPEGTPDEGARREGDRPAGDAAVAGRPAGSGVDADIAADPSRPTPGPLPGLTAVMAGLERDMAALAHGVWREEFPAIAASARAIADHPRVPPEEAGRIARILGPGMSEFKGADTHVHDLAVGIHEAALAEELEAVLAAEAELRRGCVACHVRFRERIREGLE